MAADLGELELCVGAVHGPNVLAARRAEDLDDLHQLVHAALAWEEGRAQQQLRAHAARGPNVNRTGVVCGTKDQLRGAVVARANVGHIRLVRDEYFRAVQARRRL